MILSGSRYQSSSVVWVLGSNGAYNATVFAPPQEPTLNVTLQLYQWRAGDRIDNVAYATLGDSELWWMLMNANPQYLTPWDIQPGDFIYVPAPGAYLGAISTTSS